MAQVGDGSGQRGDKAKVPGSLGDLRFQAENAYRLLKCSAKKIRI
jgi:hypothetical protein